MCNVTCKIRILLALKEVRGNLGRGNGEIFKLSHKVREFQSLMALKRIKTYKVNCDCRLYRTFIFALGFL